jgi:phosphatidylethanolamine/phosphatidyl-N-methylethanolamine N-methyltransferase
MPSDLSFFLGQLLRRPHQVVALAPSSEDLARAMVAALPPGTRRVAELGAGTGKITRALLAAGIAPADLTLFELNPEFARHLRETFPGVRVLARPAQAIAAECAGGVDAVVSGLPLLSMSDETQAAIVGGAFAVMGPAGVFVQFTYGPNPPVAEAVRQSLGLTHSRSRRVWNNLPPARVYAFRRGA